MSDYAGDLAPDHRGLKHWSSMCRNDRIGEEEIGGEKSRPPPGMEPGGVLGMGEGHRAHPRGGFTRGVNQVFDRQLQVAVRNSSVNVETPDQRTLSRFNP